MTDQVSAQFRDTYQGPKPGHSDLTALSVHHQRVNPSTSLPLSRAVWRMGGTSEVPSWEDIVVAYIDVLGWRDRIEESVQNPSVLNPVFKALAIMKRWGQVSENVKRAYANSPSNDQPLLQEISQFSDTIVASCAPTREAVMHLLYALQQFTNRLLFGLLYVRGAVVRGNIYHRKGFIFGPALLDAYDHERAKVSYPRIEFSRAVIDLLDCGTLPFERNGVVVPLLSDESKPDVWYLDPLQEAGDTTSFLARMLLERVTERMHDDFGRLQDASKREAVMKKHQWMIGYLNSVLNRYHLSIPTEGYWARFEERRK